MFDLAIINGSVWISGRFRKTNVYVKDGKIDRITPKTLPAKKAYDAEGLYVIPGLIDPHVHFALYVGERTSVDDFYYGTRSAAYGGVTSIVDFLDPAHDAEELEKNYKRRVEEAKNSNADFTFHACMCAPKGRLEDFVAKMHELGLNTLKIFTTYSDSGRRTYEDDIEKLLTLTKDHHFLLDGHVEKDDLISLDPTYTYRDLATKARPSKAETEEALLIAGLVRKTGGRFYMVHTSSGNTIAALKKQYPDILGTRFFLESCPQYFRFNREELEKPNGRLFTFAPPLRSEKERKLLVENFDEIGTIGTDHCAFMKKDKDQELLKGMPLGVGGIESSFQEMHKLFGNKVIDKMSKNVAERFGLGGKGEIKVGNDADLAIFEKGKFKVSHPHGRCDYSIYEGDDVGVRFKATISHGRFVMRNGRFYPRQGLLIKEREI